MLQDPQLDQAFTNAKHELDAMKESIEFVELFLVDTQSHMKSTVNSRADFLRKYDELSLAVSVLIKAKADHPKLWKLIPKTFRGPLEDIINVYNSHAAAVVLKAQVPSTKPVVQ